MNNTTGCCVRIPFRCDTVQIPRSSGRTACAVEERRLIEHPDECDRQTDPTRMIQNLPAIVQRAINLRNRQQTLASPGIPAAISTNKTIVTFDEFANVRRLTTEVTRALFQRRAVPQPPSLPGGQPDAKISAKMRGPRQARIAVRPGAPKTDDELVEHRLVIRASDLTTAKRFSKAGFPAISGKICW
jgi:hypothetical protein